MDLQTTASLCSSNPYCGGGNPEDAGQVKEHSNVGIPWRSRQSRSTRNVEMVSNLKSGGGKIRFTSLENVGITPGHRPTRPNCMTGCYAFNRVNREPSNWVRRHKSQDSAVSHPRMLHRCDTIFAFNLGSFNL